MYRNACLTVTYLVTIKILVVLYHDDELMIHTVKGVNPGGNGGDVSPSPCFDVGGGYMFFIPPPMF